MRPELIIFLVSAAVAVVQVILLSRLFVTLKQCERKKTFIIITLKIISYVILCYLLIFKYTAQLMFGFSGFLAGLPLAAIGLFLIHHYKEEIIAKLKRLFAHLKSKLRRNI